MKLSAADNMQVFLVILNNYFPYSYLQSLLDLALRTSVTASDPYYEDLFCNVVWIFVNDLYCFRD